MATARAGPRVTTSRRWRYVELSRRVGVLALELLIAPGVPDYVRQASHGHDGNGEPAAQSSAYHSGLLARSWMLRNHRRR